MFETKAKILIIDDRPENLHAMKITLQPLGDIEIFTAQSGNEGLSMMLEHEFALVLLDVQMPEMDGFETASLMQNHRDTRNIPIIFITAISKDETHVFRGYKTGAVDYLFKPINHDILLSKVRVFVKLFRQRKECEQMQEELLKIKNIEALGVLAGGIAHDFNNLLTVLFGNIEMARLKCDPREEVYKELSGATEAVVRARQLTQQLITFSRGGWPTKRITDIVDLLTKTSTVILGDSNINVDIDVVSPVNPLNVDSEQMAQVFENVLQNAKEAMPHGGNLAIRVENIEIGNEDLEPLIKDGKYVRITFRDNGPGIAESIRTKIFDPYFSTKTKDVNKGQGLGLTIAHSIIKKHGGYFQVESQPGAGASFLIYLPVDSDKPRIPHAKKSEAVVLPNPSPAKKILVMEDEASVAGVLAAMAKHIGYEVHIAANGREAITMCSQAREDKQKFAGAILDLIIGGEENGENILHKLKEIDPELKAIITSGNTEDPVMANYQEYGFDGALKKPFSLNSLAAALDKLGPD
jgi:two-component system cell cycle sensor histidine kinase/response regulator CckA